MKRQADLTKLTLFGAFLGVFGLFVQYFGPRHTQTLNLSKTDLALLALATFRLGRLVAYDQVFEPLRSPVAATWPDDTGAGETTVPKGFGVKRSLGELITCPICAGTWIAAGLVYALHLWPGTTRILLAIAGSIGSAELLNALTEALSWWGQAARKTAGENAQPL